MSTPRAATSHLDAPTLGAALASHTRLQLLLLRRARLRYTILALLLLPVLSAAALLGFSRGVGGL